jgi:ADP-ribosylglycohydrolase
MTDNAKAMLMASFAADAHALGVHWIYNTNVIDKKYGRVETLIAPTLAVFHRGKPAGAFTHFGDQMLLLLKSVADTGFDPKQFSADWRAFFNHYAGYFDSATKTTIANLDKGVTFDQAGSDSDDLGGAARIAPLVYAYRHQSDRLFDAVRTLTALTHHNKTVINIAELLARTALQVLAGAPPVEALQQETHDRFADTPLSDWVEEGIASAAIETRQAISDLGQACEIEVAFPATVHLLARYPDDLKTALAENVMAGGDSAARGMLVGLLLGAYTGSNAIQPWIEGMQARQEIETLVARIDAWSA